MRFTIVIALLAMVSGCASNLKVDDNFVFDAKGNYGLVVASTRTADNCRGISNSSVLYFKGDPSTNVPRDGFFLENTFMSNDFDDPPGYFQIKKLPAGKYTFFYLDKVGSMEGMLSVAKYNLSFVVKPGTILYLGEIHGDIPDCSTVKLSVVDQRERDKKLFDQRMKHLRSADFEYQILKVKP
jgi:hypothetical protein